MPYPPILIESFPGFDTHLVCTRRAIRQSSTFQCIGSVPDRTGYTRVLAPDGGEIRNGDSAGDANPGNHLTELDAKLILWEPARDRPFQTTAHTSDGNKVIVSVLFPIRPLDSRVRLYFDNR
jgi:hypothetical protein